MGGTARSRNRGLKGTLLDDGEDTAEPDPRLSNSLSVRLRAFRGDNLGVPPPPDEIKAGDEFEGDVSQEDRRRIRRLRKQQAAAGGRQGTILGDPASFSSGPRSITQSKTLLGT
jgi:hypothetical protein